MKSVNKQNIEWRKIKQVSLMVNSVNLELIDVQKIILDCSFENISKGRCKLEISEEKKKKDFLRVYTDKPLMEVNIFKSATYLKKILGFFDLNQNNNKKIQVSLNISDSLMVSDKGYLYVRDDLQINVNSISWKIPII